MYFLFLHSSFTVDGDWLLLESRKAMTNLDSLLKSKDITLTTKARVIKAMVSPVVTYGPDSWTEHQTIDALKLWCWRRLLKVPWAARRSNQSILREINPEYLLERLILKLKLQSIGHLMRTTDSLEKSLMLGKIECRCRTEHERMRWLDDITDAMGVNLGKLWEMVKNKEAWHAAIYGVAKGWTPLGDWTFISITEL